MQKIIDALSITYPHSLSVDDLNKILSSEKELIEEALHELIQKQYPIQREDNKISLSVPMLSVQAILKKLSTQVIGKKIRVFPSLESTNAYAKDHLSVLENGEIILAHEQTSGKGRLGREWVSPIGKSISMSIVLKPDMKYEHISLLTQLTAAALVEALDEWVNVNIKWPNDLLLDKKKIAGILVETEFSGGNLRGIVIGIGLNTNLEQEEIPADLQSKATSIKAVTKEIVDPNQLLSQFITSFEQYYLDFIKNQSSAPFLSVCRDHSILIGKDYWIVSNAIKRKAFIQNIDTSGALVVKYLDTDQTELITSTDLSIRGDNGYI